ncbi:MAG: helix-turn-helix domain-containing protein [Actinobacteria bacterium]|nr:helix-turn-helix domain-containing protein [Actinomycetota bacterium]MCA1721893.1 helix-turn-helix domain-containing protein [Actinomycetota bacterium]
MHPPPVVALGRALLHDLDRLTDALVAAIVAEDPSYPGLSAADLRASCSDNLRRVLQVLIDECPDPDPFDAPRATGSRRAEQGVPLESVLHAYRLGHRVIWDGLVALARGGEAGVEPLVEAASEVWAVVDRFSSAVADAYRKTAEDVARQDAGRRESLLDALLEGRGSERTVLAAAGAALDLPEQGRYAVVVLDGHALARPAEDALSVRGYRTAWRSRADCEIGLVCLGRSAPSDVVTVLQGVLAARAGVSPAVDGLQEVDVAHRLAVTALRALPPGQVEVVELDARLPAALLVTAPDLAARIVQRALGPVLALDPREGGALLETLAVWLDTGGSAGRTAERLFCHRNTVLNRLRRIEALTGRSIERVDDLVEWSLALLAHSVGDASATG